MDRELTEYYEKMFDLFSRPGWKEFEGEIKDSLETLKLSLETSNEPETTRLQGQIKELRALANYREYLTQGYEQLINPVVVEEDN